MTDTKPTNISQRSYLPRKFITEAKRQCADLGLSLPIVLGVAARHGWHSAISAFNPFGHPPPMDDVDAARQTRSTERGARKRGAR